MGNIIQMNIASMIAQKTLTRTSNRIGTIFERQASGFCINNAQDDVSGLIISNQPRDSFLERIGLAIAAVANVSNQAALSLLR